MSGTTDLRLVRLHAEGYGRLREFVLEPACRPGTVVVAANESGKSTLASAIFRGLFGFEDKIREDARRPWDGKPFRVTLKWALGTDTVCAITRDFNSQEVVVEWRRVGGALDRRWEGTPNPRGRSGDREAYDAELRRLLGFASPELFRQTVFVGPGAPEVRPLASELLRLLSGSERTDFRAALEEMEEDYYRLTRVSIRDPSRIAKQNPRRIEEIAERKAELTHRVEAARAVHAERRRAEAALAATQMRLAAIEREVAERGPVGAAIQRLHSIREEERDLETRVERIDSILQKFSEWEATFLEREAKLRPIVRYLKHPPDFPDQMTRLERLNEELNRVLEERMSVEGALARVPGPLGGALALGAGVLLAALGITVLLLGILPPAAGPVAMAIGVGLAAWGAWRAVSRRRSHSELGVRQADLDAKAGLRRDERRAIAEPLGFDPEGVDPVAERRRCEEARHLGAQLDGMREVHDALGDRAGLEAERRTLKDERLDVLRLERRRLMEANPYFGGGPDYGRRFLQEGERLAAERAALVDEELRHRRALASLPSGTDDPRRVEAEIQSLEVEAARLSLDRDALRLAHTTLNACQGDFVRVMAKRLERRVARVFEELTEGRYGEVGIDPGTLELTVDGVEKIEVPAASLSRGTQDQLYFALRVAVLEVLSAERALPLVLDDPFLHFDGDRLAQAERTLERLGEGHQILLLSHDTRLSGWTFPRAQLPEPAGEPSGD